MSNGHIYKTVNLLTGRFYIGKKHKDIRAINKYGKKNINDDRERFHIKESGDFQPENYNIVNRAEIIARGCLHLEKCWNEKFVDPNFDMDAHRNMCSNRNKKSWALFGAYRRCYGNVDASQVRLESKNENKWKVTRSV